MSKDIFGGLGGGLGELMKGLSGFMPQDDPNMQILNAQTEVNDLSKQEAELYSEIGKRAVEVYGLEPFAELSGKLKLVQINLATAKSKLNSLQAEKEAKEKELQAEQNARTCSSCGYENPEGTKFCRECGQKLHGASKNLCVSCGIELAQGIRFCGECGARQEG
jgi:ribosomal protein L37E